MKKSDIKVGDEYAVVIGHLSQGTTAGSDGLRRATVTGWTEPKYYAEKAEVLVTLAEPFAHQWSEHHRDHGKTDFTLPTRKVICTWAEHVPAAKAREEEQARQKAEEQAKQERIDAAVQELRSLLPEQVQPDWLRVERVRFYRDGGHVTIEELLAIVKAAQAVR